MIEFSVHLKEFKIVKKGKLEIRKALDHLSRPFDGYVVGIGASAGGLEALELFFEGCSSDTGLAYVVIQYLSPDHKSMMSDLLARYTKMPIQLVEDGMQVEPNQVYLIPAGKLMRINGGRFSLTDKVPHVLTLPIDIFLTSLAEDFKARSIGVVLSGTGSDGTRGAYAINEFGGFLLAQSPGNAKFNGMPNSVISTGLVDEILPAEKIPYRIVQHTKNPSKKTIKKVDKADELPFDNESALELIFKLLLNVAGVDFHDYKIATVSRRIERRMQVKRVATLPDYANFIENDRNELASLRRELFIPVTSFFRDSDAFDSLSQMAIKKIVGNAESGKEIRVWVAGVSSGEEVYSIVILFMEMFERLRRWPNLKVFATDVNPHILEVAAAGQYPESIAAELTSERLDRFFVKVGENYSVKPEVRQCVVFAKHNLLSDPPFTKMDLVSCRNTLIYFKAEAQVKAIHRLQYAAKLKGFLFLGSSESLTSNNKGFEVINSKHKIFRRTVEALSFVLDAESGSSHPYQLVKKSPSLGLNKPVARDLTLIDESIQLLMQSYSPPSILVDEGQEAIHFFGDIQPYFKVREGSVSLKINRILDDSLVSVVTALVFKATKDNVTLYSDSIIYPAIGSNKQAIRICVRPVPASGDERFALVVFEDQVSLSTQNIKTVDIAEETNARIDLLQQELAATRESLQATIEELETSNEELQATNEELMASNEELQSSNEELQSVNEEMNTVNSEFQEKVLRLNQLNADLEGMAKAVGVGTLFVDPELNITRYSPDLEGLFKLRSSDVGRPLNDIRNTFVDVSIIDYFEKTLLSGKAYEKEVRSEKGQVYLLRILPYSIPSRSKPGAVATFTNITVMQDRNRLQSILDALPEHIAVLSNEGTITLVNAQWRKFAKANGDPKLLHSDVGSNYLEACHPNDDYPDGTGTAESAYMGIKGVLEGTLPFFSLTYPCDSPSESRKFVMNVAPIVGNSDNAVVVSHNNISNLVNTEK